MQSDNVFSYSTKPHSAPIKRKAKYRDDSDIQTDTAANLMYDSRVIRGTTFSLKLTSNSLKANPPGISKASRGGSTGKSRHLLKRSSTPPPVAGRMHMDMQTDDFIEELTGKPVETDAGTQTQAFMDRPASPLFVRAKTGVDVVTQILPGDLFDFDLEVEPVLEVLVGKTIHVAMLELMQEEELEAIYRQQEEFELMRKVELAEVQRLEADARRKTQEKERRVEQEKDRAAARKTLEVKIAAQSFAHQYLGTIHNSVFDLLHEQGFFYDPLRKEIEDIAMTDLLSILKKKSDYYESAQLIIDELIVAAKTKAKCYERKALILRREAAELHVIEIARAAQLKANADMIAAQTKAAEEDEEDREGEDSFV